VVGVVPPFLSQAGTWRDLSRHLCSSSGFVLPGHASTESSPGRRPPLKMIFTSFPPFLRKPSFFIGSGTEETTFYFSFSFPLFRR